VEVAVFQRWQGFVPAMQILQAHARKAGFFAAGAIASATAAA